MNIKIYSPYVELLWKRIPAPLDAIKDAGYDGVECHLIGNLLKRENVLRLRERVAKLGLEIRFHQGWSWETGQRNIYNIVLRPLGALLPIGTPLHKQVGFAENDVVVVYGNYVEQPMKPNFIYQTASEHRHGKDYVMDFPRFVNNVQVYRPHIVFDTQHVFEWYKNKVNVEGLPIDPESISPEIIGLWEKFQDYTVEIQLCDFDPHLGASRGRNVFLGDGVFPLDAFCSHVKKSGWNGVVTPEVSPQHLQGKDKLMMLRKKIDQLFR